MDSTPYFFHLFAWPDVENLEKIKTEDNRKEQTRIHLVFPLSLLQIYRIVSYVILFTRLFTVKNVWQHHGNRSSLVVSSFCKSSFNNWFRFETSSNSK